MSASNNSFMNATNVENSSQSASSTNYILDTSSFEESSVKTPSNITNLDVDVLMGPMRIPDATNTSDVLMHAKDDNEHERIVLPITQYKNVLLAPKVLDDISEFNNEPFSLLKIDSDDLTDDEIKSLIEGE
jgi:hypothetical protein